MFTGRLGSKKSTLANIVLGTDIGNVAASHSLAMSLAHTATSSIHHTGMTLSATSTLSLTQVVGLSKSVSKPISQTLSLTQTAFAPRQIVESVTDNFSSLTDETFRGEKRDVSQTLALSDEALVLRLPTIPVTDVLAITQSVKLQNPKLKASSTLNLDQTLVLIGPIYRTVADTLTTTQTIFDPVTFSFVSQTTGLTDVASEVQVYGNRQLRSIISLSDRALGGVAKASGISKSASNTLDLLSDSAHKNKLASANVNLSLSDSASAQWGSIASNLLSLIDSVVLTRKQRYILSDTLGLTHSVLVVLEGNCDRFTAPLSVLPAISGLTGFRLRYPSSGSPSDEVVLSKSPEFGNTDRFQFDRILRETRGGSLRVFADPIWPKIKTLVLKFSSLRQRDAYALQDFMANHPGQEVLMIDWEDRAWVGVITQQQNPVTQDDRNSYTASFEFEGERA